MIITHYWIEKENRIVEHNQEIFNGTLEALRRQLEQQHGSTVFFRFKEPTRIKTALSIFEVVCNVYQVTQQQIESCNRLRSLSDARKAFTYVYYKNIGEHPTKVADILKQDHSTTIAQYKSACDLIETDKEFRKKIDSIEDELLLSL